MGLLNKDNKVDAIHTTLEDISSSILVVDKTTGIRDRSIVGTAVKEMLTKRISNLNISVLWEEWTADTAPTIGIMPMDLWITAGQAESCFLFEWENKSIKIKCHIVIKPEFLKTIPIRVYQRGVMNKGKWTSQEVAYVRIWDC